MVCQYQELFFFFCFDLKKLKIWVEYSSENYKRLFLDWFCDSRNPGFLLSSPAGRFGHQNNKNVVLGSVTVFYHIGYGSSTLHAVFKADKRQIFMGSVQTMDEVRQLPTPSGFD